MAKQTTPELIAEKADTLFYERGFEATSFADIAKAVGISRGNFYHHFKSKDDILDAVITRRLATTRAMLAGWEADADPAQRTISFVRILIVNRSKIMAYGCPVGTLNTELTKLDHSAQNRASDIFALFRDWLASQFAALGHRQDAQDLAMQLLARSQGVAVMASAFGDEGFLRAEVAAMESWLASLPKNLTTKRQGH